MPARIGAAIIARPKLSGCSTAPSIAAGYKKHVTLLVYRAYLLAA